MFGELAKIGNRDREFDLTSRWVKRGHNRSAATLKIVVNQENRSVGSDCIVAILRTVRRAGWSLLKPR